MWWGALCLSVLFACLSIRAPLAAQGTASAITNFVNAAEDGANQTLDIYFTLLNPQGQVIIDKAPTEATLLFEDGTRIDNVEITQPHDPIFIALVFDVSGSMRDAEDEMKQAAKDAVNSAPPEAFFAVYQFDEEITLTQGMTTERALILQAIDSMQVHNRGTCLYDATAEAINLLNFVDKQSRRAVVLFTDGRDELVAGGELDPCSHSTLDQVITSAQTNRVSLYTIGLQGNSPIAARELQDMSSLTGGLARIGNLESLPSLFQQVMQALASQWRARAAICVPRGSNRATLNMNLDREKLPSIGVVFDIVNGCERPTATPPPTNTPTPTSTSTPLPLQLAVNAAQYFPETDTAVFTVERSGDGVIDHYEVQVTNAETGNVLLNQQTTYNGDANRQVITLETQNLPAVKVQLVVSALGTNGITLARSPSIQFTIARPTPTPTPSPSLTPTLAPVSLALDPVHYDPASDSIQVNFFIEHQERIVEYRIDLIDKATNQLVRSFTPELEQLNLIIPLPVAGLLQYQREYVVRVVAVTNTGERITQTSEFTYTATPTPSPTLSETPTATFTPSNTPTPTPTETLIPVLVEVANLTYDAASDTLTAALNLQQQDRVIDFTIDVIDDANGNTVGTFRPALAPEIRIPTDNLRAQMKYRLRLTATLYNAPPVRTEYAFTYTPQYTPTPTPTDTLTPTLTPTATTTPGAAITGINFDADKGELVFTVSPSNEPLIDRYQLQIVNADTNLVVATPSFDTPPYDRVTLPVQNLITGDYTAELRLFGANGEILGASTVTFTYTQPPTPTPSPAPGLLENIQSAVTDIARRGQENPINFAVVIILLVVVLLLIFLFIRRLTPRHEARGRSFNSYALNPEKTEIIGELPSISPPPPAAPPAELTSSAPSETNVKKLTETTDRTRVDDYEVTRVETVPYSDGLPPGFEPSLHVISSDDRTLTGKTIPITKPSLIFGRREGDIIFADDQYVSRRHARLQYENGEFFVEDLGSQGGTFVNGTRTIGRVRVTDGMVIRLGSRTNLRFSTNESNSP